MGLIARTFIFDDTPSEVYNLYVGELGSTGGGGGESTIQGSSDVTLLVQKLYRRPIPLFFGTDQTPVLQFPFSAYCPDSLDAPSYSEVSSWLFGQSEYKKLRFCQEDMAEYYFNCFLLNPQMVKVGNYIRSFNCNVVCDAPWAWSEPETHLYTYNANAYNNIDTIYFLNKSANNFYTYPTSVIITANIFGGSVSITNVTDNNRLFLLTLLPNEVATLNCDTQQITSTTSTYPLYNFNLNFLRFLKGFNTLSVSGNITSLSITYPIAVKVG